MQFLWLIDFLFFTIAYIVYAFFYKNYIHIAFQHMELLSLRIHHDTKVGIHHNISIQENADFQLNGKLDIHQIVECHRSALQKQSLQQLLPQYSF